MKRLSFLLMACVMLIAALTGCAAPAKQLTKVTVNEVTHSVFYAPQYAAMQLGYFAEQGIEVDLVNGGGSDKSMTALLSGDADIGLMGPETAVYVYNEGKEDYAVIIGQLTQKDGSMLVGREADPDFEWSKLKGKTIIGGRKGGMPNMTLEYVLRQNGLEPGVDVTVDTSVQFNLMAGAFEGSEAEYVALFEPTASMCEVQGKGSIVASVGAASGSVPYTAYMIKKSSFEKNKDLYTRYMTAVAKAQKWVDQNDAATIAKTVAPLFPDSDVEILTKVAKNYKEVGVWKTTPEMLEPDFEQMQTIIDQAGELDKKAPFADLVNNKIAIAVSK